MLPKERKWRIIKNKEEKSSKFGVVRRRKRKKWEKNRRTPDLVKEYGEETWKNFKIKIKINGITQIVGAKKQWAIWAI